MIGVKLAWRSSRRAANLGVIAVVCLSVAVGATVLELVYSAFLRAPQLPRPGEIYRVNATEKGDGYTGPSAATFDLLTTWDRVEAPGLRLGGYIAFSALARHSSYAGAALVVAVDPNLLLVLGVAPQCGRAFVPQDERQGSPPVAIVSHELFLAALAGDTTQLGHAELQIGSSHWKIIGAMPPGFQVPLAEAYGRGPEVLIPMPSAAGITGRASTPADPVNVVARVGPDTDALQVQQKLAAAAAATTRRDGAIWGAQLTSLQAARAEGEEGRTALLLIGAACVLALGFLNAACLLGVDGLGRSRERSIKLALGASRLRLRFEAGLEGAVLGAVGGGAGAALSAMSLPAIGSTAAAYLSTPAAALVSEAPLLWCAVLAACAGFVLGFLASGATAMRRNISKIRLLAVVELGLAVALVSGAALVAISFIQLQLLPRGYSSKGVVVGSWHERLTGTTPAMRRDQELAAVQSTLTALGRRPELSSPAVTSGSPLVDALAPVWPECAPMNSVAQRSPPYEVWFSSAGIFGALGIPVVRGDLAAYRLGDDVVAVDEDAAQRLFGTPDAVGRHLTWGGANCATVVAVVGNLRRVRPGRGPGGSLAATQQPHVYTASPSVTRASIWHFDMFARARSAGDSGPVALASAAQDAIPSAVIGGVVRLADVPAENQASERFQVVLAVAFALLALAIGLTGVFAFTALYVGQRRGEMAVRIALGDTARGLFMRIAAETALLGGCGAVVGLVLAFWVGGAIRSLLFEIAPNDWRIMVAVGAGAVAAAVAAGVIPAAQAARTDPNLLLRDS